MREDVLIVLNEREPLKQQMAIALSEQLESRGLTHHRLKPTAQLADIVVERSPRIVICDFLLGDEGTAFDLLARLRERDVERKTECLLWTDERSVSVAVNAIKLGARDYIELGSTKDIEKVLRCLEEILAEANGRTSAAPLPNRSTAKVSEEPVAQAEKSRSAYLAGEMAVHQGQPVIVLSGPTGCGRSTLARHLHGVRRKAGLFTEIALENWAGSTSDIFGSETHTASAPLLSGAGTLFIDHSEFDVEGELLEALLKYRGTKNYPVGALLIVGTTSPETAAAWKRLADAKVIEMPALAQCREDFIPLLQRFLLEAKQRTGSSKFELSPEFIDQAAQLQWPGNIRQLRACALDVFCSPPALLKEWVDAGRSQNDSSLLFGALEKAKAQYELSLESPAYVPPPLAARRAVDEAGGNFRIAAAYLGIAVPQLRSALSRGSAS